MRGRFRGFPVGSVDMMEIDGVTLRQRLILDRAKRVNGALEMGKLYYMELREAYSGRSPEKAIAVQNESEPEDRKLMACVELCFWPTETTSS